jgi:hypothetical protein
MLMLGRMLTMAMALLGGILFSQAPEFAQQYRQRIGGALDELRAVITQFDTEANRNGLDRERALGVYSASPERFLHSQGDAMRHTFNRYENLEQQSRDLQEAQPLAKPFVILRNPDPDLIINAWHDFSPGVPITIAGIIWAVVGLIIGWLVAALFGTASLRARRPRQHVKQGPRRKDLAENAGDRLQPTGAPREEHRNPEGEGINVEKQAIPQRSRLEPPERLPYQREMPHQTV